MIKGFIVILSLLLLGNTLSDALSLPIPGAVIGMVLLLIGLIALKRVPNDVGIVADGLVKHIGLLFVPAGAGLSVYLALIADNWWIILCASFMSTFITLTFVTLCFRALKARTPSDNDIGDAS